MSSSDTNDKVNVNTSSNREFFDCLCFSSFIQLCSLIRLWSVLTGHVHVWVHGVCTYVHMIVVTCRFYFNFWRQSLWTWNWMNGRLSDKWEHVSTSAFSIGIMNLSFCVFSLCLVYELRYSYLHGGFLHIFSIVFVF